MEGRIDWPQASFAEFERSSKLVPSLTSVAPILNVRKEAFRRFCELGFPTTRNEDWKYTSLAPLSRHTYFRAPTLTGEVKQGGFAHQAKWRAVVVNGVFRPELSELPERSDLFIGSISEVLLGDTRESEVLRSNLAKHTDFQDRALVALNTAFLEDGVFVWVKRNAVIDEPVTVFFLSESGALQNGGRAATNPRTLIVAEECSKASFIEYHTGEGSYFSCPVSEVTVGENAFLEHVKIQRESESSIHIGSIEVALASSANYTSHLFHFGGGVVRNEIHPVLNGEGGECYLNGLTVLNREQHVDNFTVIDHATPNCFSREIYKGIYNDRSAGVFSGTIIVRPGAQKTNAIQSNNSILLSEEASIETKPQLKIWADDVKCTHGATVGQIDEKALFYLRSRGISEGEARKILIHAFASDVINHLSDDNLRGFLEMELYKALSF